ncbi:hypothetical protein EON63_00170 [archaeon]|nr:MAG: hypothetical protein EON63_00170 [archaeon]
MLRWLAAVDNSGISAEFPLVANADASSRPEKQNEDSYFDNGGACDVMMLMVYGVWCMVYGIWCMVYGVCVFNIVHGVCYFLCEVLFCI